MALLIIDEGSCKSVYKVNRFLYGLYAIYYRFFVAGRGSQDEKKWLLAHVSEWATLAMKDENIAVQRFGPGAARGFFSEFYYKNGMRNQ